MTKKQYRNIIRRLKKVSFGRCADGSGIDYAIYLSEVRQILRHYMEKKE